MYHIKNDKRQENSAMALMEGLMKCLQKKKMSDIGVSDLCSEAGVSRSTFYRMFDTPVDVLEYSSDTIIKKTIADYSSEDFRNDADFILFTFMYWHRHVDILEAAVNCGRLDIVRKSFEEHSERLVPMLKRDFSEMELEYLQQCAVGLVSSLLLVWLRRGKKETPMQMFELYRKFYFLSQEGLMSRDHLTPSRSE